MANLLIKKMNPSQQTRINQHPLERLQNTLDQVLENFYGSFEMPSFPSKNFESLSLSPAIDIVDDKNHFKVEAEMPGMGEEDIKVSFNDGVLTIKGEKTTSSKNKDKNYLMREISYGSYERHIRVPDSADLDKAKASFKKGMLWIEIPKKVEVSGQNRQLKVEKA